MSGISGLVTVGAEFSIAVSMIKKDLAKKKLDGESTSQQKTSRKEKTLKLKKVLTRLPTCDYIM
jgi:hypothetical protein